MNFSQIRRGEYKTPGGKLVAVTLRFASHTVHVVIDGDFFIDGTDNSQRLIDRMQVIAQEQIDFESNDFNSQQAVINLDKLFQSAADEGIIIGGITPQAIAIAVQRAIGGISTSKSNAAKIKITKIEAAETNTAQSTAAAPLSSRKVQPEYQPLSKRWNDINLAIIPPENALDPAMQMAVDEVMARAVAAGDCGPMLRFWEWKSSAVVIGLHQSVMNEVDLEQAQLRDFTVVRRITGGGAMFIEPGNTITYSMYVPLDFVEGLSVEESYRLCDEWVIHALQSLGVEAAYKPINDITSPYGKIGGAAQRRFPRVGAGSGCVLHHVTMAYDIDSVAMTQVLRISREKLSDKAVQSAAKRVDPLKSQTGKTREEVIEGLIKSIQNDVPHTHRGEISQVIWKRAAELSQSRYLNPEWLNRIP